MKKPIIGSLLFLLAPLTSCSSTEENSSAGAFLTHTARIGVLFGEAGTNLCIASEGDAAVLESCDSDDPGQHWEVRKDFTLHNADRDRCLYWESDEELVVMDCDSEDSRQHWLITLGPDPYTISRLPARDRCIGKTSPDSNSLRMLSCNDPLAFRPEIRQPTFPDFPPFPSESLPPTNTGSLRNIQALTVDGFGDVNNKYAWSMVEFRGDLYVGTLNSLTWKDTMEFCNDVAINTNGSQVWRGRKDAEDNWSFEKVMDGGLDDTNNFGLRKMITCGTDENGEDAYILGVTMNNAAGFSLLRYDGQQWTTEFRAGSFNNPPSSETEPRNVSGRGMVVFNGHLFLGVANNQTGGKIWRRPIDQKCDWTGPWEVVTDNGFDEPDFPFQNTWFGDMVAFKGKVYTGTLNYGTGGQIWRSETGDPGRLNWEKVFDAGPIGEGSLINVIKLFHWEKEDSLVAGGQDTRRGGRLLASSTGDPQSFQRLYSPGMTGDLRNTYLWYIENFKVGDFDRLYLFWSANLTGFQTFSIDNLLGEDYLMESLNAFNMPNGDKYAPGAWSVDYYGGRTALQYDGQLIQGTASGNTSWGLRVYAADPNPSALGHEVESEQLRGPSGPVTCLLNGPEATGTLLNNGEAWLDWRLSGNLQLLTQGGPDGHLLWESHTLGVLQVERRLCFELDGKLSVTDPDTDQVLFESSSAPTPPARMVLQSDCNLQLIDATGTVYFETGTAGQCLSGMQQ